MKTQADAVTWLQQQIGAHLDYDHQYGQQCVDFWNFFYQFCTNDNPYADDYGVPGAKDLWAVQNGRLDRIPDSSTLKPQPGDAIIYGPRWGAGNGHVEMVLATDAHGCHLVGENEHNNPSEGVTVVYRTWGQMAGMLGILRMHWAAPVQYVTVDQVTAIYRELLERDPDVGGLQHYVGHYTYDFTYQDVSHSVERAQLLERKAQANATTTTTTTTMAPTPPVPEPTTTTTTTTVGRSTPPEQDGPGTAPSTTTTTTIGQPAAPQGPSLWVAVWAIVIAIIKHLQGDY